MKYYFLGKTADIGRSLQRLGAEYERKKVMVVGEKNKVETTLETRKWDYRAKQHQGEIVDNDQLMDRCVLYYEECHDVPK